MAENKNPAACSDEEFQAARKAGLLVISTDDERAIHEFAETIRKQAYAEGYAAGIEFIATGSAA